MVVWNSLYPQWPIWSVRSTSTSWVVDVSNLRRRNSVQRDRGGVDVTGWRHRCPPSSRIKCRTLMTHPVPRQILQHLLQHQRLLRNHRHKKINKNSKNIQRANIKQPNPKVIKLICCAQLKTQNTYVPYFNKMKV